MNTDRHFRIPFTYSTRMHNHFILDRLKDLDKKRFDIQLRVQTLWRTTRFL